MDAEKLLDFIEGPLTYWPLIVGAAYMAVRFYKRMKQVEEYSPMEYMSDEALKELLSTPRAPAVGLDGILDEPISHNLPRIVRREILESVGLLPSEWHIEPKLELTPKDTLLCKDMHVVLAPEEVKAAWEK